VKNLILSLIFILGSHKSFAAISFSDGVFPEFITSARALALGNAYIALADDAMSAMYNPAGLGSVRKPHLHLSNIAIEINQGWTQMGTGGFITNTFGNLTKGFSLDGIRALANNNKGKISNARIQAMPNFTARYYSFGYLLSSHLRGTVGTAVGDQFEYATRFDHGPYLSLNLSLMGGLLKFGVTTLYLFRTQKVGSADPAVALNLAQADQQAGQSLQVISGMKFTLPFAGLPTIAMKMNNSLGNKFVINGTTNADPIKQSLDLGIAITPQMGNTLRFHLELNYKDALKKYGDVSDRRRLQLGFEMDFGRRFFIRGGYGDGFGSGGIGIKSKKLEFDLTSYAVDTTSNAYRGQQDRRYMLAISTGF